MMIRRCKVCGSKLNIEQISRKYHIYIFSCDNKKCLSYECEGSLSQIWLEKIYTENYVIEEQNRGSKIYHQIVIYKIEDDYYEISPIELLPAPFSFKYCKKINLKKLEEKIKKYLAIV